jgi:hypothetical protein
VTKILEHLVIISTGLLAKGMPYVLVTSFETPIHTHTMAYSLGRNGDHMLHKVVFTFVDVYGKASKSSIIDVFEAGMLLSLVCTFLYLVCCLQCFHISFPTYFIEIELCEHH